jgi:hypothetical protein
MPSSADGLFSKDTSSLVIVSNFDLPLANCCEHTTGGTAGFWQDSARSPPPLHLATPQLRRGPRGHQALLDRRPGTGPAAVRCAAKARLPCPASPPAGPPLLPPRLRSA